jgi:hypothetical protein
MAANPVLGASSAAQGTNLSYPTIAGIGPATPSFSGGPVIAANVVTARVISEDTRIPGALVIDPAIAAMYYAGKRRAEFPVPGNSEPPIVASKEIAQRLAQREGPNAWKLPEAQKMSNATMFGTRKPQTPFKYPWNKKLIPPLALFNDASQWVNRLMFNKPNTPWSAAGIGLRPPRKSTWMSSPPINTTNLAAGQMNLQLQLGQIMIQQQQLSLSAANYYSA